MVVEIENPVNRTLRYDSDRILVKTIEVPDRLPKKVLYSNKEAELKYIEIENDIYEGQKSAKPYQHTKFPAVLKILGGVAALAAVIFNRKSILHFFKNVFKK